MPPTNSQHPGMAPNDAAAALALATHLSTQLAAPQQPQEAQNAPVEPAAPPQAPDLSIEVEALQKEVDSLKKQVAKDPQDDIKEMKAMIEQALAEEDTKEHGK